MKIIKKLFSFVCCLFLAVSCFAPCAFAMRPHDGEHCYFTLKANPGKHLSVAGRGNGAPAYGGGLDTAWFTACGGPLYYFILGKEPHSCPEFRNVLDESVQSSAILGWRWHGGHNQQWVLEPAPADPFYRIKNVQTGRYATYNPPDNLIWGYRWCATDNQIWVRH